MNLPHDIDSEFALLGAILCRNQLLDQLAFLGEEHFYNKIHGVIFSAMLKAHAEGKKVSPFTISISNENLSLFDDFGGVKPFLAKAVANSILITDAPEQGRAIVRMSGIRDIAFACQNASNAILGAYEGQTVADVCGDLTKQLDSISKKYIQKHGRDDYEVTEAILNRLKDNKKPYSTGMPKLDEAMGGGFYPGKSYGVAARKKVGKTTLASTISCNLNLAGVPHLFICGEMSDEEIQERNLARLTESYPSAFRTEYGQTTIFQNKVAQAALASNRCIKYENAPGITFDKLREMCAYYAYKGNIKGIILDYWQLVGGKQKGQSDAAHLDEVAQWIANFGRKHDLWTLTMAQINQEGNTRGGEGIRLAFDQVYQLHRDDVTQPEAWLEMMETRYTKWMNIGSKQSPGLIMREKGPWFDQA